MCGKTSFWALRMINALPSPAHLYLFVFSSLLIPHWKKKNRDFILSEIDVACHLSFSVTWSYCEAIAQQTLSIWKTVLWGWYIWAVYLQIFSSLLFLYIVVPSILFCKLERGKLSASWGCVIVMFYYFGMNYVRKVPYRDCFICHWNRVLYNGIQHLSTESEEPFQLKAGETLSRMK